MKTVVAIVLYGGTVVLVGFGAWLLPRPCLELFQPATIGAAFVVIFGALYVGELKQESVGQLYQAIASAWFKTTDLALFNSTVIQRIRSIRKWLLLSNLIKLIGALAAVYLLNEKPLQSSTPPYVLSSIAVGIVSLGLSLLCFARLWFEVSRAEDLLIQVREDAISKQRRQAFVAESNASLEHDFEEDDAAQSFSKKPKTVPMTAFKKV